MHDLTDDVLHALFRSGLSYGQIAVRYGVTRNVIAGRCRKAGLRRGPVPLKDAQSEARERERDRRDPAVLRAIDDGMSLPEAAVAYRCPIGTVRQLARAAREAAHG